MRGCLLLSVVGALLYGLLLLIADMPDRKAEHSLSGQTAHFAIVGPQSSSISEATTTLAVSGWACSAPPTVACANVS